MVKKHIPLALLLVLMVITIGPSFSASAQTDILDQLPPCNFTGAAPDSNIVIGAVVLNLQTGRGCAENLDMSFPVASVPKIFVAATLFEWILGNDVIGFDTELTFTDRYWMGGQNDCLNGAQLNSTVTLGEMSDIMIACSDNAATWMLMDAMGWDRVDNYVASLGIEGIGQVIPYSEVDRQKLIFLDERWRNVPISMASRFYRSDMVTGLNTYFDTMPTYTREQEITANQLYFENTSFNTMTPRAMAEYLLKLNDDVYRTDDVGQVARWVFNTMLLTQRQFSSQAFPGTVTVGAKNGFDTGLRAEVNVMFNNLPDKDRYPSAIALVFARQTDFDVPNLQPPTTRDSGILNQYLLTLSPVMSNMLYPSYTPPDVIFSRQVSTVVINPKLIMDSCWYPYEASGFLFEFRGQLESCWLNQPQSQIGPGDGIGVGMVLQNLNEQDTRITFIFTDPNGAQRSYQTERFFQDSAAVYWFHPVPQDGIGNWTVDIFVNRNRVATRTVEVKSLY